MFTAKRIAMADGQSYENVQIMTDTDLSDKGFPVPLEEQTIGFVEMHRLNLVHNNNITLIHLDGIERGGKGSFISDRISLRGNVVYEGNTVIPVKVWQKHGVPFVLKNHHHDPAAQIVFSNNEGTFMSLDSKVVSMTIPLSRNKLKPMQIINSANASIKETPKTVHGKIQH
jgi:hypothetical protein